MGLRMYQEIKLVSIKETDNEPVDPREAVNVIHWVRSHSPYKNKSKMYLSPNEASWDWAPEHMLWAATFTHTGT